MNVARALPGAGAGAPGPAALDAPGGVPGELLDEPPHAAAPSDSRAGPPASRRLEAG